MRHRTRGFTALEAVIATAILSTLVAAAFSTLQVSSHAIAAASMDGDVRAVARKTVDQIANMLIDSGISTFTEPMTVLTGQYGTPAITFRKVTGYNSATNSLNYGPLIHVAVKNGAVLVRENYNSGNETVSYLTENLATYQNGETKNGLDDNKNGLIDEPGLCFHLDQTSLTIAVTITRTNYKRESYTAYYSTVIHMRN